MWLGANDANESIKIKRFTMCQILYEVEFEFLHTTTISQQKGENHCNLDNILLITLRIVQRSEYES